MKGKIDNMLQVLLSPAAGKRLISKAALKHNDIRNALRTKTIVIVAGSTNGYIAEEILKDIGQDNGFSRNSFFRGITLPPTIKTNEQGRLVDESKFIGDVVIQNGIWIKGKTIFDVQDELKNGDIIIKGANSVNVQQNKAGILVGHPKGGTIMAVLQAVVGKRAKLIIPVGLEKRTSEDIDFVSNQLNDSKSTGLRMLSVSGEIITEIEAIRILFGLDARMFAAGGVGGAEGSVWISVEGAEKALVDAKHFFEEISVEQQFNIACKKSSTSKPHCSL